MGDIVLNVNLRHTHLNVLLVIYGKNSSLDLIEVVRCVKRFGLVLSAVTCILILVITF